MFFRVVCLLIIAVTGSAGCVAGGRVNDGGCDLYRFEDGVQVLVNQSLVGPLNPSFIGRRGPTVLSSMEIAIPNLDQLELFSGVKSLHLSAFFRPLQGVEVECQEIQHSGYTVSVHFRTLF